MNGIKCICACILLFLAGVSAGFFLFKKDDEIPRAAVQTIVRDTIVQVVKSEPVKLERVRTKIIYRRDTVFTTTPFTARIDTVVVRDTVNLQFDYPENLLSLRIARGADSVQIQKIVLTQTIEKKKPWWEIPAIAAASAALGFLLGATTK